MHLVPLRLAIPAVLGIAAVATTTAFAIGGSLSPAADPGPRAVPEAPAPRAADTVGASAAAPVGVHPAPVVLPPAGLRTGVPTRRSTRSSAA